MSSVLPVVVGLLFVLWSVAQAQGWHLVVDGPPAASRYDHLRKGEQSEQSSGSEQMGVAPHLSSSFGTVGPNTALSPFTALDRVVLKMPNAEDNGQPGLNYQGSGGGSSHLPDPSPEYFAGDKDRLSLRTQPNPLPVKRTASEYSEEPLALNPTVTISAPRWINSTANFTATATFTFSVDVTGFETEDVTVDGGTKGTFSGSGKSYTLVITPDGSEDVVVTVVADAATDGTDTGPATAKEFIARWDATRPSVTITGVPDKINSRQVISVVLNFSEPISGSDLASTLHSRVTPNGAALDLTMLPVIGSGFISDPVTIRYKPDGSEDVVITVLPDLAVDRGGQRGE